MTDEGLDLRLANMETEIESLRSNIVELHRTLRIAQEQLDTRNTRWWKRFLFWLDGWPRWTVIAEKPAWRPWRRWWTS